MATAPPGGDPRDRWVSYCASISNPSGLGQGNVSSLLRRVAERIEELGDIVVSDITFESQPTEEERDLTITVYYERTAPS